ncbi:MULTISPECIES: hypothetical protein [unclassified Microcoleus]|uniref:hypothetical protein n=1 Tax=unclassified Microcoleus TaxID=2642155 RepID=UPI001D8A4CBB|nr:MULTISPECIES: hypothetical protein [unclassified Microcoleus]MCC3465471.1 hypothetical protein [Microcoleus sp. PH2017_06_SFM_O_A]MCC3506562.1 hypothetical protein [Microcoleus sp. PH2017_19_SFW_U_A]MCC3525217.1 hypothetical protein [Microcoleus sp. PH2017_20_SFW_D_A]MCC3556117.1 hypothetical protein [Microcoleus sp. PH2017_35_SFW_U_B]MCC3450265.1 hypothetical protein [Microcoleus sp. PH2017_09_SFU_O_A]
MNRLILISPGLGALNQFFLVSGVDSDCFDGNVRSLLLSVDILKCDRLSNQSLYQILRF